MNLDLYIFNLINRFAGKWKWLDLTAIFFAKYLAYFLAVILALFTSGTNIVFSFLPGIFARIFINEPIYFFYKRKRPVEVLGIEPLIKKPNHPSFPSGHASFFFAISFYLLAVDFIFGIVFLFFSFLISLSRIFSGVHWPSDILGGIASGAVSFLITYYFLFPWISSNL